MGPAPAERPPDTNPVRTRARLRRMAVLLAWWAVLLLALLWLSSGGPLVLVLPIGVVGILVVANTVVLVRRTGSEETALEPDRLRLADQGRDAGVAVWAARSPRRRGRERGRRTGTLEYGRRRLTFTPDPLPDGADDPLAGRPVLDARVDEIELGPRPGPWRPVLVLSHQGVDHVIDLSPPSDLGAGVVGAMVAAAWWDQLVDRGARATMAP